MYPKAKLEFIPIDLWIKDTNFIGYELKLELKKELEKQNKKENRTVITLEELLLESIDYIKKITNNDSFSIYFLYKIIWKIVNDKNYSLGLKFGLNDILTKINTKLVQLKTQKKISNCKISNDIMDQKLLQW